MRKTSRLTLFRRFAVNVGRRFINPRRSKAMVIVCLATAMALIGFMLSRQATTSVGAQQLSAGSEAASFFEAGGATSEQTLKSVPVPRPEIKLKSDDRGSLAPSEVCGWTDGTVHPVTILDQATVSQGGFLYTFGGVSTAISANARKFDGTTWTDIAPLPAALEFPTAVSDGTFIYILGGALTGTGTPQTTLYKYDPAMNSYTPLASFTTGTWNAAAVYLNGKIYKFAGTGPATASTDVLEIYDIGTNMWTTGTPYPLAISFVGAFTDGTYVYGAGGIQSVGSLASLKTYRYDPGTSMWDDAAVADLPLTRWGAASSGTAFGGGANGGWVLAGGYVNGTVTANISTSTIRWNAMSNTWSDLAPMTAERSRMTGAILGSSFYVVGGRSVASSGFVGTNSNQKLSCIENVAVINQGSVSLVAESFPPGNMSPDPGELVTVSLPLINSGDIPTTALTATLQATGGVTSPSAPQNYGAVAPDSMPVSKNFSFTVNPALMCGDSITLTWTVADGATNYANATKVYVTGNRTVSLSENFDGVTAPTLPTGWTSTQTSGTGITWTTTTTTPSSGTNAAFGNDPATVNAAALSSPPVMITSSDSQLTFKNKYITESGFDGTVLEYSTDGGMVWTDVVTGGGSFVTGGYNAAISTAFMNPIGGRMAWTGTSAGGYIDTVVNLPASLNGQSVSFRWLTASDNSVAATGQWVDDVQVFGARVCDAVSVKSRADFDGDGKTDLSVFRPSEGNWYLMRSTAGFQVLNWGLAADVLTPGDFDGDGKADTAVFRANADSAQPDFYILNSNGFTVSGASWGVAGDIPVVRDYDGDGKADIAIFRPSNSTWYVINSSGSPANTITVYGQAGDVPVAGDFDGDGKGDLTVYRAGTWLSQLSGGGSSSVALGSGGDVLVPADYDGDNKDDVAVFRPSGLWYVVRSTDAMTVITNWGAAGDVPVPGDYDGDGKDDYAIYRNGQWWLKQSTSGDAVSNFGVATDQAIPRAYVP